MRVGGFDFDFVVLVDGVRDSGIVGTALANDQDVIHFCLPDWIRGEHASGKKVSINSRVLESQIAVKKRLGEGRYFYLSVNLGVN